MEVMDETGKSGIGRALECYMKRRFGDSVPEGCVKGLNR